MASGCPRDDDRGVSSATASRAHLRAALPRGQALAEVDFQTRHRAILYILAAHVIGIAAFGVMRGYSVVHSVLEASVVGALTVFAASRRLNRSTRGALAAMGLVTSSAMIVHLSGGTIEAHFHFFVVLGLMTLYQDWIPYGVAFAYVILHHGVLGVIDPASVYQHVAGRANPWIWAAIHGGFVLAASIVQIYSWRINEFEHARAERLSAEVLEHRLRKHQALQINDNVVQGLVVAKLAASMGDRVGADQALDAALVRARGIISDLIGDTGDDGFVIPGDLVRDVAATHEGVPR